MSASIPTTKFRTRQVFRYLQRVFPPPLDEPWTLVMVDGAADFGGCDWPTKTVEVDIAYPQPVTNSTLVHEWAHVLDTRPDTIWNEETAHDDFFWSLHGRIYRRFYEEGGAEESAYTKGVRY